MILFSLSRPLYLVQQLFGIVFVEFTAGKPITGTYSINSVRGPGSYVIKILHSCIFYLVFITA